MTSYMAGARFFVITTKHYTHTHCQHCTPPTSAPIPTQAGLRASLCSFCGSLLLMVAIVKKSFCTISLFLIWRIFKEQYSVVLICIIQLVRDWGDGLAGPCMGRCMGVDVTIWRIFFCSVLLPGK